MSEHTNTSSIPSDDQVEVQAGNAAWRPSKGHFCRGRGSGGTEQRDSFTGIVRRVGVHRGMTKDNPPTPYEQLEVDLETSDGLVHLKASVTDQKGNVVGRTTANVLAWVIQQVIPENVYRFTTSEGKPNPKTPDQSPPTYVNIAHVVEENGKRIARPIYKEKRDPNAPTVDVLTQWLENRAALEKHPLWALRPERSAVNGGESHLKSLIEFCIEKHWPHPEQSPEAWLTFCATATQDAADRKAGKTPIAAERLSAVDDDDWGQIILAFRDKVKKDATWQPAFVKKLIEAGVKPESQAATLAVIDEEYDPFTDQ